jgi:membrane protein DedA with SNARE-associated domain
MGDGMAATYVELLALAAVTAVGVPGPGDAALLAAGVLAAQGRNFGAVLVVAFVGYVLGGRWSAMCSVRGAAGHCWRRRAGLNAFA